jgi:hypothetical protein
VRVGSRRAASLPGAREALAPRRAAFTCLEGGDRVACLPANDSSLPAHAPHGGNEPVLTWADPAPCTHVPSSSTDRIASHALPRWGEGPHRSPAPRGCLRATRGCRLALPRGSAHSEWRALDGRSEIGGAPPSSRDVTAENTCSARTLSNAFLGDTLSLPAHASEEWPTDAERVVVTLEPPMRRPGSQAGARYL